MSAELLAIQVLQGPQHVSLVLELDQTRPVRVDISELHTACLAHEVFQILSMGGGRGVSSKKKKKKKFVEMVISNLNNSPHTIHKHTHPFFHNKHTNTYT